MYGWLYNLINIGCSLVGYYLAAAFIDNKFYGRRRMQSVGFLADFICFIIPAALYDTLLKPGAGLAVFQFLYFFSSFWNQFGPNATTFLVAAECYPASVRATAHGFSAAWGKLGALAPGTSAAAGPRALPPC
jgi:sugar phosphate permease